MVALVAFQGSFRNSSFLETQLGKWSLLLTFPLSLISLFTIIGSPYLLKRKIERTKKKLKKPKTY